MDSVALVMINKGFLYLDRTCVKNKIPKGTLAIIIYKNLKCKGVDLHLSPFCGDFYWRVEQ